jgi:integrase
MIQQGQVFKLKTKSADGEPLWAYRYRVAGRGSSRVQVGGFATQSHAQKALQTALVRLQPGSSAVTTTLAEWVEDYLGTHQAEPVTLKKLRWLLGKATAAFGEVQLGDLSPAEIAAWRMTIPEGHRFETMQALRQVLNRAVAWRLIDDNPAKRVPNPSRPCREQRPFGSWEQIRTLAARLGPVYGPMILFGAATGLRPAELLAVEHGDIDRRRRIVHIRRAYANGKVKPPKTKRSRRAVPLQAIALEALDQLQAHDSSPLLFPNARGGYLNIRNFNRRHWNPAQKGAGMGPPRDLYDLRHTYATFAIDAGVNLYALSRFMGTSIAMLDRHYGHLMTDSHRRANELLDAAAIERAVDAGWTPARIAAKPHRSQGSPSIRRHSRRLVDARWTPGRQSVASAANRTG